MTLNLIKCFSILVAAEEGRRCIELRDHMRECLLKIRPAAGKRELDRYLCSLMKDIKPQFFWPDITRDGRPPFLDGFHRRGHLDRRRSPIAKLVAFTNESPLMLHADDRRHVFYFRHTLEWAMRHGLWNGIAGSLC